MTKLNKKNYFDFKGLMAPVFTCFKEDDNSLDVRNIDRYAQWLKSQGIAGVLVNSISGEGPALNFKERKQNAEMWWQAATKYNLVLIVNVGGAPIPDVLSLAQHAEKLGVHGVMCLPELFYKPLTIEQLVGYCKIVASKCSTLPFFYYHAPDYTGVDFDMCQLCDKAEREIPNFFGIQFSSLDLDMGTRCLREGRVILLGSVSLLASAMLLGFESAMFPFINGRPNLVWIIYNAMKSNNIDLARKNQLEVNDIVRYVTKNEGVGSYVGAMKNWFNREMFSTGGAGFSAGPARKFF